MNKWNLFSLSALLVLVLYSCGRQTNLELALEEAGETDWSC